MPAHDPAVTGTHAAAPAPGRPHLQRSLSLRHIVFIGLSYMAPLAVFDTFGIVADETDGRVPLAYLVVLVAVAITAAGYAKMVRRYPAAGSAYTYTAKAINPHVGFLVGWTATLDYLLLPMINALLSSIYMTVAFPSVPAWVWIALTILVCTVLNLIGVRLAAQVNLVLVVIQIVVAVAFVVLTVRSILSDAGSAAFGLQPFSAAGVEPGSIMAGAAVLALSFLGFDAVSTLAEEAEDPRRDIPRAILVIVAAAGVFFVAVTYAMQTLFPDVSEVGNIVGASPEIARHIGGAAFQAVFIGGYLVAVLGCGITQQMSAARLLYAMGRDGALPRRPFALLNRRLVPSGNLVLIGVLACSAMFLDLNAAASMINFGAFVAFIFVNASVIATYVRFVTERGFAATLGWIVLPVLGIAINLYLWFSLDSTAKMIGGAWALLGIAFLLWRTRFFRAAPPAIVGD